MCQPWLPMCLVLIGKNNWVKEGHVLVPGFHNTMMQAWVQVLYTGRISATEIQLRLPVNCSIRSKLKSSYLHLYDSVVFNVSVLLGTVQLEDELFNLCSLHCKVTDLMHRYI